MILVKTTGGKFGISINDGTIRVGRPPSSPDFVMICGDPRTLLNGLAYKGALTDSVISKKLMRATAETSIPSVCVLVMMRVNAVPKPSSSTTTDSTE